MKLTPMMQRYILHWGEMGTRWGVNRTVAQIHALLFLSDRPLPADEIVETLTVARSNVSTSLRELQSWGLVTMTHVMGDRRDHFEAQQDPWDMLETVVDQRKKREVDPTLAMLRQCLAEADRDRDTSPEVVQRIRDMHDALDTLSNWYDNVRELPRSTLLSLVKMGDKVARAAGGGKGQKKKKKG